jgi:DEAD/DEAH box helicase domain-containing protein
MNVQGFLETLKQDPEYAGQMVHVRTEAVRAPLWSPLLGNLRPEVVRFLGALGVTRLYFHQADAIAAALDGRDVLVTTGPASGKSLCYQVPILQTMLESPDAAALLVFPAKALAHDQVAAWARGTGALADSLNPRDIAASPFDADTDSADRRLASQSGRLLATNPEMLHVNLLPRHAGWARFFRGLRFVALDEVHTYAGFFGANMANVLRRLERLCEHYGSSPRFICSSATVGNPKEMAERITGRTLHHVSGDASASGSRTYLFWNPPRIKQREWRGRRSANVEAHELMVKLIRERVPTICFSKARNTAEMIYRYVRETLEAESPGLAGRVVVYRGGYSAEERREMERRLRDGDILGVSATRALELGIDIGSLEACIVVGYPGVLHAFLQQAGRAGRAGRDSLCILVGTDTAINQYIMAHPDYIFGRPVERAVLDENNPFVVVGHLRCAAAELPVRETDIRRFGYASGLAMEVLEEKRKVRRTRDAWYHASSEQPAHVVRLRGYGDESTVVMDADSGKVMDRLDKFRALRIFYPGAVYFHHGDTYEMVHHDFERNIVQVRRTEVSYYTDPVTGTSVDHIDAILDERPLGSGKAFLGEVFAVLSTPLYERVQFYTLDRLSQHETDVPPVAYEAMSFWLETPPEVPVETAKLGLNPESGMLGLLYCVSRILPLFLTSDANDFDWTLGCRNSAWHTMFWYEFYLHGIGHAEQCYQRLEEILGVTLEHLLTCDCEDGCPNCTSRLITPYHVRNIELGEGQILSRQAAVVVLNSLLTGRSAEQSMALLSQPREKRGQRFLPTVTWATRQQEPHRMPLDDRTRGLLLRKLERDQLPKLPVDHPIESVPQAGIPPEPAKEASPGPGGPKRPQPRAAGSPAGALSRSLRQRLGALSAELEDARQANRGQAPAEEVRSSSQEPTEPGHPAKQTPTPLEDPVPAELPPPSQADAVPTDPAAQPDASATESDDPIARHIQKLKRRRKP